MRALNEGDVSISTVVRAQDQALTRIDASGPRVTLGAGVTFARVLAERDLGFLHAPARSIGGPAVRNMGTVGGNLFAQNPYGDFTVALLALDATVAVQGGFGSRDIPIEDKLRSKDLRVLIQQGLFREDLFFRLNVAPVRLPPLRDRTEDADHQDQCEVVGVVEDPGG